MKKAIFLFVLFIIQIACSKTTFSNEELTSIILTKSEFSAEDLKQEDVSVSVNDIQKYLDFREKAKDYQPNTVITINPVEEDSEISYYVIQYEHGWEVLSADKRGPIILAHSDDGTYEESISNEEISAWMTSIVQEIDNRKKDTNHYNNISDDVLEKESASLVFWKMVTADTDFLNKKVLMTKPPVEPIEYEGYWLLISQYQTTVEDGYNQHLIQTKWHQRAPFNYYCPYRTDETDKRAPAGCVAIAGAQMLYYLHYTLGTPLYTPTTATSIGNIYNYSITVSGSSSTAWDLMITDDYDNTRYYDTSYWDESSPLVVQTGIQINMDYGNHSSGAYDEDLVNNVFGNAGIYCQRVDYSTNKVLTSLKNDMPVIASARQPFESGHAFIIDGYHSTKVQYFADYQWMEYLGNGEYMPIDRYLHEVTYSSPTLQEIYMNWGWGGNYDNVAYSPSGVWEAGGHNYSQDKKIIYNFAISQ